MTLATVETASGIATLPRTAPPMTRGGVRPSVLPRDPHRGRPAGAVTARLTGAPADSTITRYSGPASSERATTALARTAIDELARMRPRPQRHDTPALVRQIVQTHAGAFRDDSPARRLTPNATGFAATYLSRYAPNAPWVYAADTLSAACVTLADAEQAQQRRVGYRSPRLAWATRDGRLILDEISPANLAGLILDDWMTARIAADMTAGRAAAGEKFLGVRIVAIRLPYDTVFCTSDGEIVPGDAAPAAQFTGWWS
jgi:hypothetical protein